MRLAIVTDWLPLYAGAEHVIAEFHKLWPDAPIYTTIANHGNLGPLDNANICTGGLQKWYMLLGKRHRCLLPWMPMEIERIDLGKCDVILSSSHAIGKGIIPPSHAKHICYCHTPMRYAWGMEREYLEDSKIPVIFWEPIRKKLNELRRWDMTTAKRVDKFAANSTAVAERIREIYNREAVVIHPPVDDRFYNTPTAPLRYCASKVSYLALGRLVPYKRFDLLIELANKYGIPLKIAGNGPDEARLKSLAGPTVEFLGYVPDNELPETYASSKALLYPQEEDAGIAPLEAQACGTPVIALKKGGAVDTVIDGTTGVFFEAQTAESLKNAIDRFEKMSFFADAIRTHAGKFRAEKFREKILELVNQ